MNSSNIQVFVPKFHSLMKETFFNKVNAQDDKNKMKIQVTPESKEV